MANPIINVTQVRELALYAANQRRQQILPGHKPFARAGDAFTDAIEAEVRSLVIRRASAHWQKGVTLT